MYCDACGKNARFAQVKKSRTISVRGVDIDVPYTAEVCGCCGEEMYNDDLEVSLLRNAASIYRGMKKMVPADKVAQYMSRKGLTAEQFASLANCAVGEIIAATKDALLDADTNQKIKMAMTA